MTKARLLALLALAACGPGNRSLDTQKAPVVSFTSMAYDLKTPGERIDGGELRALASYLRAIGTGYGDRVTIGGATMTQRATVASIVSAFGAAVDPGGPAAPAGTVHVDIRHASATVPGCPDWRRVSNPEIDGSAMSNFGCASRSNLAAMVADPTDLIEGKTHGGGDALATTKGVKAYRDKPARDEKTINSLAISTRGEGK